MIHAAVAVRPQHRSNEKEERLLINEVPGGEGMEHFQRRGEPGQNHGVWSMPLPAVPWVKESTEES